MRHVHYAHVQHTKTKTKKNKKKQTLEIQVVLTDSYDFNQSTIANVPALHADCKADNCFITAAV